MSETTLPTGWRGRATRPKTPATARFAPQGSPCPDSPLDFP
ncbi:hypothetical protein [Streptomyces sp. NPDC007905]